MNIASVPCRCGQSWTVPGTGPSERGTPANCGPRSASSASMRAPCTEVTTLEVSEITGEQVA